MPNRVGKFALSSFTSVVLVVLFLQASGAPDPARAQAQSERDWKKIVDAGKKEGQVSIYMGQWGPVIDAGVFQKAFPEIKVVRTGGGPPQIMQQITAERRAGKYIADVIVEGINPNLTVFHANKMLDPIKPALVLPEVLDESKWWQGKHHYADPERQYVLRFVGSPQYGSIYYNTNLVKPGEIKSVWDFLNPKWKGKIGARDIRQPGPGNGAMRFFYYSPKIGADFIKRLFGQMDVALFRETRQGVDWLANGKFAICFFCSADEVRKANAQGLPVDTFGAMSEGAGLVSLYGTIVMPTNAPHPNAARVFINWFLSRDGQLALQRELNKSGLGGVDSLRIDIPKDDVTADELRNAKIDYLDLDARKEWLERKPILDAFEEGLEMAKKR
jgi:ABC-type Fe3+ transport system substrate-binding protein